MNWRLWTWNDITAFLVVPLMVGGLFYFFFFVPHYSRDLKSQLDCVNPKSDASACAGKPTNIPNSN